MSAAPSPLGVVATTAVSSPAAAPVPAPAPVAPSPSVWPRSAQIASAALVLTVLGLLTWHVYGAQRRAARPTALEPGSTAFRIDLNKADRAQLMQLPNVGDALARRIEEYRTAHYGFRSVEELAQVPGVGPLTVERLRHLVYVEAPEDDEGQDAAPPARAKPTRAARKETPPPGQPAGMKKDAPAAPVDVNKATAEELQRLPGIGPVMASRIVEARKTAPFKSVDDLRRVPGIGPKTLDKLRPHVTVGPVKEDPTK